MMLPDIVKAGCHRKWLLSLQCNAFVITFTMTSQYYKIGILCNDLCHGWQCVLFKEHTQSYFTCYFVLMNLCATLTFLNMLLLGIVSVTNIKTIIVSAHILKRVTNYTFYKNLNYFIFINNYLY